MRCDIKDVFCFYVLALGVLGWIVLFVEKVGLLFFLHLVSIVSWRCIKL